MASKRSAETVPVPKEYRQALDDFFAGTSNHCDLPLDPSGTTFQKRVWSALRRIPKGSVVTYAELARSIGRPKAARAVGNALHKNPIPFLIPCHRVRSKEGIGGFALGVLKKKALLRMEGVVI